MLPGISRFAGKILSCRGLFIRRRLCSHDGRELHSFQAGDRMNIGDNIRRARQQQGLTQAALAEKLGVSDRAVSRWETNTASPDVTLLAQLALTLETSTDALLGVDPQRTQAEILQTTQECTRLLNAGDTAAALALMREKARKYPNQPELMVYLSRVLLALKTEDAAREALRLCRAADGKPMRLSSTYGCKQVMATALHRLGQSEQAARLVEDEMPAIFVSRELLLPRFVPPERANRIRRSNVDLLAQYLTETLDKLQYQDAAAAIRQIIDALPPQD